MSDPQLTDQQPQAKTKHAGGRPRKPKPAPPLPPPARYSLQETVDMGDKEAREASPAARLRWVAHRALLVKEIQDQEDAACDDALEIDNKHLRERVEALEKAKQTFENELASKDRDLIKAESEKDKLASELKEMTDAHRNQLVELTNKMRAADKRAAGLLPVVRYVCGQMKERSETDRIEYAAQLMHWSHAALMEAKRLGELIKDPETHRERYAAWYRNIHPGVIEAKLNHLQIADREAREKQAIEDSMKADVEIFRIARSKIIPDDVMNQVFELLSVTRQQVSERWEAKQPAKESRGGRETSEFTSLIGDLRIDATGSLRSPKPPVEDEPFVPDTRSGEEKLRAAKESVRQKGMVHRPRSN